MIKLKSKIVTKIKMLIVTTCSIKKTSCDKLKKIPYAGDITTKKEEKNGFQLFKNILKEKLRKKSHAFY